MGGARRPENPKMQQHLTNAARREAAKEKKDRMSAGSNVELLHSTSTIT